MAYVTRMVIASTGKFHQKTQKLASSSASVVSMVCVYPRRRVSSHRGCNDEHAVCHELLPARDDGDCRGRVDDDHSVACPNHDPP